MDFLRVLCFLSFYSLLAFAEFDEKVHTDDNVFGPLELSDTLKSRKPVAPQTINLTGIIEISDKIKSIQKKLEEERNYVPPVPAYLTISKNNLQVNSFMDRVFDFYNPKRNKNLNNFKTIFRNGIVNCANIVPLNQTDISPEIVNSSRLYYVLKNDGCSLILFYASSCQFSNLAFPHYYILQRIFPQIKMVAFNAVSEYEYGYNKVFGLHGVPSLFFVYNGVPVFKFKGSDYSLYEFTKFVIKHTNIAPNKEVEIPETFFMKHFHKFENVDNDYCIWLAWFVIIFWARNYFIRYLYFFGRLLKNMNVRQEARVQHEHAD